MKYRIAFVACLLFTSLSYAQNITGIWRGYFYSGVGMFMQKYKYEVQIDELGNKSLEGVTYSYRTTEFYGKATLKGVYNAATKTLIFKEKVLVEVKTGFNIRPCLMTCYVDYNKQDNVESLEGTFTSMVMEDSTDCGNGTVYLKRVQESDFHKEDFLLKKNAKPQGPSSNVPYVNKTRPSTQKPTTKPQVKKDTTVVFQKKGDVKPPQNNPDSLLKKKLPVPPALTKRENDLVKTIVTNSPDIKIELYDNGEIDGDTVTVYHNNAVVAYKKGLSTEPITINIVATPTDTEHEFVMYADNLGRIPPNTALMVITTGGQRYEMSVSSTLQKNAKVLVEYQP